MRTIVRGDEYMTLDDEGRIARKNWAASGKWIVTGAKTLDNFGNVTRSWTLAEILADPSAIPWLHANGRQRTHITDLDGGTHRMWFDGGNLTHRVF